MNSRGIDAWITAAREALLSGTLASFFSTGALAALGKLEKNSAVAPTNATSHWLWGERAYEQERASLRYTAVGYGTHHASAIFWATLYERWLDYSRRHSTSQIVGDAAGMAAVAAFVDYVLTPPRLRPGFEKHLSLQSMIAVYSAFAAGLAAGALLNRQHERRLERILSL